MDSLEANRRYKEEKRIQKIVCKQKMDAEKRTAASQRKKEQAARERELVEDAIKKTKRHTASDPLYKIDRAKSRMVDPGGILYCEIHNCNALANDIHHITQSMRGKRTHKKDGSDLIALCRDHHDYFHAHDTFEERERLYARVGYILSSVKKNEVYKRLTKRI